MTAPLNNQHAISETSSPALLFRPASLWIGFFWGLAEATLFFVVPDVFLTLVALLSFRRSARVLVAILAGALLGGSILYFAGERFPGKAQAAVLSVPFVSSAMLEKTRDDLERSGIWTMAKGPRGGIPYKIYAVQASRYAGWPLFLLVSVLARLERFALFWIVAGAGGAIFRKNIANRPRLTMAVHAVLWTAGYAVYWWKI